MNSDMGNKEWLNEFEALKQVNPNNPFTVPAGYFDEAEQMINSRILLDETAPAEANGFTVPENYFDELSANIQSRINIEAFVNNPEHGHAVPAGYFDNLEEQINARIFVEEALGEEENFTVPEGYFNQLNKAILNKTVNQKMVKRKGVVRRMFATGAFKYAAAACFALVVGTGVYLRQITDPVYEHDHSYLHKQLSSISVNDIQSYLQDDVDANDTQPSVIDEGAPVNDADLSKALQGYNTNNNE